MIAPGSVSAAESKGWEFHRPAQIELSSSLAAAIYKVFLNGFGREEGWSPEGILATLSRASAIGLLRDSKETIAGYAIYQAVGPVWDGRNHLLWEDAICVNQDHQHGGLAFAATRGAMRLLADCNFGWLGGRTQSLRVLKRYMALLSPTESYPFPVDYESGDGPVILDYLRANVEEVRKGNPEPTSGICRSAYKEGALERDVGAVAGTERIEAFLARNSFDRDSGDAVVFCGKLRSMEVS